MAKHIKRYSTKEMSPMDWQIFRERGLGGSDIPALLGISNYKSKLELYLEKIGEYKPFHDPNRFTFYGTLHEPEIAELYQYWEGDVESMIDNYYSRKKVNHVRAVKAYITNEKYPQLFASIDRMILRGNKKSTGILECKNTSSFVIKKYQDDIPYEFVVQLINYLLVTEYEYADLALEIDGNDFKVYPYEKNDSFSKEIMERIQEVSALFWMNVVRARKIKHEYGINSYYDIHPDTITDSRIQDSVAQLQLLEPEVTPDEATEKFLNKIFSPKPLTIPGTSEMLELAVRYNQSKENEKLSQEDKMEYANKIKAIMKDVEKIDFEEAGSIHWKQDSKGVRRFSVNLKNV